MLANHFHATVLDALPESTHALDQTFPDGTSMSGSRNLFSKGGWANKTAAALSYTTR